MLNEDWKESRESGIKQELILSKIIVVDEQLECLQGYEAVTLFAGRVILWICSQ